MRIEIRRNNAPAILITFNTRAEKFESNYERSKFFRELHGWEQTVPRNERRYRYHRPGLLDEVPHMRVNDSVFIVAMEHMRRMEEFFEQWSEKVECDMMQIFVERDRLLNNLRKKRIEIDGRNEP
jgi:hypothetical protein